MRYIINNNTDPYFNIALEEYCLMNIDVGEDYFILWQNEPSVIIGKNQNALQEINKEYVEKNNIKVVRRISGGGAVYHDLGNLNFTFITQIKNGEKTDFSTYAEPIVKALKDLGVDAMLMGRNDLIVMDKKVSGNAQRLHRKKLMQHGTLLFDLNIEDMVHALDVSMDKIESKGIKSIRSRVGNIREFLKEDMTIDRFKEILQRKLSDDYRSEEILLKPKDIKAIEERVKNKFATWEWTYGKSPPFNYKAEKRFKGGKIGVFLHIKEGIIQECKFYGDYLALIDTEPAAAFLFGLRYDKEIIREALVGKNLYPYFGDITLNEMLEVLF